MPPKKVKDPPGSTPNVSNAPKVPPEPDRAEGKNRSKSGESSTTCAAEGGSASHEEPRNAQSPKTLATPATTTLPLASSSGTKSFATPKGRSEKRQSSEFERQRESLRQAYKLKHDKVRLALWPTPEAESDFKRRVKGEINYERLDKSVRFQDAWKTFSAMSNPSGADKDLVKRAAIEAHLTSRRHKKAQETENTPSKKRQRHRSSSSTREDASPSVRPPKDKSAKPSAMPETKSQTQMDVTEKTESVSTAAASPKAGGTGDNKKKDQEETPMSEEDGDVVEDEDAEPSLAHFTADMNDALGGIDYAAAAKGENFQSNNHVLFIHKGDKVRERITREVWKVLLEKLNSKIFDLAVEGKDTPKVLFSGFKTGTGVIVPADKTSQELVINLIAETDVNGQLFKAWPKGKEDEWLVVTIKAPVSVAAVSVEKFMHGLAIMNGFDPSAWKLFSAQGVKGSRRERLLRIIVKKELFEGLKHKKGYLFAGTGRVEVHHKRVRLC